MNSKLKFLLIILLSVFMVNCTIQKRSFNKGYFVQWNFKQQVNSQNQNQPKLEEEQSQLEEINPDLSVVNENLPDEFIKDSKKEKLELNDDITIEKKDFINNFEDKATKLIFSKIPVDSRFGIEKITKEKNDRRDNPNRENFGLDLLKALLFITVGVLLIMYAFTKKYPFGFVLFLGVIFFFWGVGLFILSIFRIISRGINNLLEKQSPDENKFLQKKRRIILILGLVSLLFLSVALILSIISQLSILYPIFLIAGFSFLLFTIIFFFFK